MQMGIRMKTYKAIEAIGNKIIQDGLCEAILLKGSIGRGDDDAYSDVDMYAVVTNKNYEAFLERRHSYLNAYNSIVYTTENDFGMKQTLAIFSDALHFDLYTVIKEEFPCYGEPIKVYHDPDNLFGEYRVETKRLNKEQLVNCFNSTLYYFVEADSAYQRKNYAWTARIMDEAVAGAAMLIRYIYDKEYAYLGLKKLNEKIPSEQYSWVEEAYKNLREDGFTIANAYVIRILEFVLENLEEEMKGAFDLNFFRWLKENLHTILFQNSIK
jgi:predicted nucleotidyltransferase